jgi:hypothetical protein
MEGVDTHETMKNPDPIEALHATVERLTQETARAIGRQTSGLQFSLCKAVVHRGFELSTKRGKPCAAQIARALRGDRAG